MSYAELIETEVFKGVITPAIHKSGSDIPYQVRREYSFIDGKTIILGKRVAAAPGGTSTTFSSSRRRSRSL